LDGILTEAFVPAPQTVYGKSKLLAEEYISSFPVQSPKRVYILRPCMIHGPGNKGNLNLLYRFAKSKLPWPLGAFQNKRSFCSIGNLLFVIDQLLKREDIPSGIYNIADDDSLSTSRIVEIIGESIGVKTRVLHLPVRLIRFLASIGNIIGGPLNTHALVKLTENYRVDNQKIKSALGCDLPVSLEDGFRKTFESFKNAK
jgi:nucleoside-diphosphate-sugar epimerase